MNRAFVLVALAGCAETAPTTFVDPPMSVTGNLVTGPSYTMRFSQTGIKMPEVLTINGVQVLGSDSECNTESLIGVGLFPAVNGIAGFQGDSPVSTLTPSLQGPAVVRMQVDYSTGYTCGSSQHLTASSTFTFFPNGRIVRKDVITPTLTALVQSTPCGCGDNTMKFFLTSFWAFDEAGAMNVDAQGTTTNGGLDRACTMYADRAIGVSWNGMTTRVKPNKTAAHVFDVFGDVTSIPAGTPPPVFSAIKISDQTPEALSDCAAILSALDDGPIKIGGATVMSDDSGIYFDPTPHAGTFEITTAGNQSVPSGFAISVDIGTATHAYLSRTPAGSEEIALVQRVDETRVIFVFRDGLSEGETITIEPS